MIRILLILCAILFATHSVDAALKHQHYKPIKYLNVASLSPLGLGSTNFGSPNLAPIGTCTTNGSDGFAAAPAGTGQFPTLLNGYAATPNWCVAGVHYAVGINSNATVSGNTITVTSELQTPTNGDGRTFYPQNGGSLPSGITAGTEYFVCGKSGSGTTFSFTLWTANTCGGTITLGSLSDSFISLKAPKDTTNTPTNTTGWIGSAGSGSFTFEIDITGVNAVIDHWDFSLNGGWMIFPSNHANITVTNNNFVLGSNFGFILYDEGGPDNGITFNYNIVDANSTAIYTTSSAASSGATQITVANPAGIIANLTVGDITTPTAIVGAGGTGATLVTSVVGSVVHLSKALTANVIANDTIGFVRTTAPGSAVGGVPQNSISDEGATVVQYNLFKDTCSEMWQQSLPSGTNSNLGLTFQFNVWTHSGWCGPITGAHGDVIQLYGTAGSTFAGPTQTYNTIIQDQVNAASTTTTFSDFISGTNGAHVVGNVVVENNTGIYPVAGTVNTSTNGLGEVNPTWVNGTVFAENNYVDPTSAGNGGGSSGAAFWMNISPGIGGGTGPFTAPCTTSGNINLKTGGALPLPAGSYC